MEEHKKDIDLIEDVLDIIAVHGDMEIEIQSRDLQRICVLAKERIHSHVVFSDEESNWIWKAINEKCGEDGVMNTSAINKLIKLTGKIPDNLKNKAVK